MRFCILSYIPSTALYFRRTYSPFVKTSEVKVYDVQINILCAHAGQLENAFCKQRLSYFSSYTPPFSAQYLRNLLCRTVNNYCAVIDLKSEILSDELRGQSAELMKNVIDLIEFDNNINLQQSENVLEDRVSSSSMTTGRKTSC